MKKALLHSGGQKSNCLLASERLIDGKYSIKDLVDVTRLRALFEEFSKATGFTTGFISYPGQEILISTGWREACTKYHRLCPASMEVCRESNMYLTACPMNRKDPSIKRCGNGLVEGAAPVIIRGKYLACVSTGQVLFEPPDLAYFKRQAKKYGYDEKPYLAAIKELPVVYRQQFEQMLRYLSSQAVFVAEEGLNKLQARESELLAREENKRRRKSEQALKTSEGKYWNLFEGCRDAIIIRDRTGRFLDCNDAAVQLFKCHSKDDFLSLHPADCSPEKQEDGRDSKTAAAGYIKQVFLEGTCSFEWLCKKRDGAVFPAEILLNRLDMDGEAAFQSVIRDISKRRSAEKSLRMSEERNRTLVEQAPDGLFVIETQSGRFGLVDVNFAACRMLGYSREGVLGMSIVDLVVAEEVPHIASEAEKLKSGETAFREWHVRRKDGSVFPCEVRARQTTDGQIQGFVRDLTDLKRAGEELRMSEEKYRSLFANMTEEVHFWHLVRDEAGRIKTWRLVDANPPTLKAWGKSLDEIKGRTADEIVPGATDHFMPVVQKIMTEGVPYSYEDDFHPLNKYYHLTIIPFGEYFITTAIDITNIKKEQVTLRESEERFRQVTETIEQIFWMKGADHNEIIYISPSYERIWGRTCQSLYDSPESWIDAIHPEDRQRIVNTVLTMQAAGKYDIEYRIKRPDGAERWIHDRAFQTRDATGKVYRITGVAEDITERKRTMVALRRSEKELADFFHTAPGGLLWVKPDGHILRLNEAALKLFGCTSREALDQPVSHFFLNPKAIADLLHRLAKGETIKNYRVRIRQKDQSIMHALIAANGLCENEQLIYSRWFLRDITRQVELEREILGIIEREQRRLGHDLHDDLCQQLAGIEFLSQTLANRLGGGIAATKAKEIAQLAQNAMTQTREIAQGLSPVPLETEGLMAALKTLAMRTQKIFHIDCHFQCEKPVLVSDHTVGTHLYRIAQEAVGNAVKHGKARCINIGLTANDNNVVLAVSHDGLGIPVKIPKQNGMGLRIMQYRSDIIGASLHVQREPNGSTTMECTVPNGLLPPNERMLE